MKLLIAFGIAAMAAAPAFANDQAPQSADAFDDANAYSAMLGSIDDAALENRDGNRSRRRADRGMRQVRKVCEKVNVTEEQKPLLKDAVLDYKESTIQLKADLKTAKLKFVRLVLSDAGDATAASSIVSEGVTAKTGLVQAKGDLATKILFTILTAEQREPALKCLRAWKKAQSGEQRRGRRGRDH